MNEPQDRTIKARLKVQTKATVLVTHRGNPWAARFSLEVLGLDDRESEKSVPVLQAGEPKGLTLNYEEREGF
jgi:hypothetical protein